MKTTVNVYQFRYAFNDCGRGEQFSYEALGLLFDYLEQYEEDSGEEIELDVIAICCDYSEDTPEQVAEYYGIELDQLDDDIMQQVVDYLNENTQVVGRTDSSIVYAQF